MTKLTLLGTVALAGSLVAGTAMAQNGNPAMVHNGNANASAATNLYTEGGNGNGGGGGNGQNMHPINPQRYANVGFGNYMARQNFIQNGNNNNNNNGNNNNNNWRPSQRNNDLADNGDARASKVIGTGVFNAQNQQIGSVNDILLGKNGVYAVISTNNKKIAVPFNALRFGDAANNGNDKIVIPNATQARLNTLPVFHYNITNYQAYQNAGNNGNGGNYANNGRGNGWLGGGAFNNNNGNNNGGGWHGGAFGSNGNGNNNG